MAWKTQRRMTACTSKAAAANKLVWGHTVAVAVAAAAVVFARPLAKIWLLTSRKTVLAHVDVVTAVEAGPGCRAARVAAVAAMSSAVDLAAGFWHQVWAHWGQLQQHRSAVSPRCSADSDLYRPERCS